MNSHDSRQQLQDQVKQHLSDKRPLYIQGGGSKKFLGYGVEAAKLDVTSHCGIIHYEPTELVITARCGTKLSEIETALAEHNQMLAFEPPHFSANATLGGCIATGLSGPRRPFTGSARDFVLGMSIINGKGEIGKFGGEVMKNVAGYDVSRMMVGSLGTLGVILDVSLKVLPKPEAEITVSYELTERAAISRVNKFCASPLPITATCFDGHRLYLRLSGTNASVNAAKTQLGGEVLDNATDFWLKLREQSHSFFKSDKPLWRLSLAPATPPLELEGKQLHEWRGGQRWLVSSLSAKRIREKMTSLNGHATLFKNAGTNEPIFHPLQGKLHELNINLKLAMDPDCIFNPGRMYEDF